MWVNEDWFVLLETWDVVSDWEDVRFNVFSSLNDILELVKVEVTGCDGSSESLFFRGGINS